MIWQAGELKNPESGKSFVRDTAHSLTDGRKRFPVVDEIPFLRAGREELQNEVLHALDLEDKRTALILLLQDQDDWAKTPPPTAADLQPLFYNKDLTLREAMQHLKYGAVADYFAYRWSDPTFLSGLALLQWHLPPDAKQVFELCCGIGHYLRELTLRSYEATGADVVFSKLWLARRFVAPTAKLVCFDANKSFPLVENFFHSAFCHDAFYFLPEKRHVAEELKRVTKDAILIGHAHNAEVDNYSSGAAVSFDDYIEILGDKISLYDDADLTRACLESAKPEAKPIEDLRTGAALAFVINGEAVSNPFAEFAFPLARRTLRINPLMCDEREKTVRQTPVYQSERYESEYAALSGYLNLNGENISDEDLTVAARGEWANNNKLTDLARRRILLDLPEKW
jgi:SAM-dependent methyltransferase